MAGWVGGSSPSPRIEHRHAGRPDVLGVARDEREAMVQCRRGELGVDRRHGHASLPCERLELAPPFGHRMVEWKDPARESRAYVALEPREQRGAPRIVVGEEIDALPHLTERDHAQMKKLFRRAVHPGDDAPVRSPLHQLRYDIRIQQEPGHLRLPLQVPRRVALPFEDEVVPARRRCAEEIGEAIRLLRAAAQALVFFDRQDHHRLPAFPYDVLRAVGAGAAEQLAEARLGLMQLPDAGSMVGVVVCHALV
jgi:hypothetical protein